MTDRDEVLALNAEFYASFERADFDRMAAVWATDEGVVCVHPGAAPLRGHLQVMRSWMALMAGVNYIQFFLTDVESAVVGDVATVSCTENVLAAAADSPIEAFTGGKAVATNVFRRTSDGWRLWVHHASPVLSAPEVQQGETP